MLFHPGSIFTTLLGGKRGNGRRHCNENQEVKVYETRCVRGVYQTPLKSGESIGILTPRSHTDIDKINGDNPK